MKVTKKRLIFAFCVSLLVGNAQTLMTIQNEPVNLEEFKRIYSKNSPATTSYARKDVMEYVNLFTLYKMKLLEAKATRIDTLPSVKEDYLKYTDQLAVNTLNDKNYVENLMKAQYEHMKYDLKVAHIMVKCDATASPSDSLIAYNKIKFLRDKTNVTNFADVAKESSEDKASAALGGTLGYLTAFMTTPDFEDPIYQTELNTISPVFRTSYGYHFVKVMDKRAARGRIKIAHIFVNDKTEEDKKANKAEKQIQAAFSELNSKKIDFNQAVSKFSADKSSADKGGELPEFGISEMIQEFEDQAFTLKNPGDFSRPFKTDYGWHIVKLIERKPIKTYEASKDDLRRKMEKDARVTNIRALVYQKLLTQNNVKENAYVLDNYAKTYSDSFFSNGKWLLTLKPNQEQILFTINGKAYTLSSFVTYINKNFSGTAARSSKELFQAFYSEYKQRMVWDHAKSKLSAENIDYRNLESEYMNGLMIFELMDREIWKKAVMDTIGAKKIYEEVKNDYKYGERAKVFAIKSLNKGLLTKLMKDQQSSSKTLSTIYNEHRKTADSSELVYSEYTFERGDNKDLDQQIWKAGNIFESYLEEEKRNAILQITGTLAPTVKPFNEVRGRIQNIYQTRLEVSYANYLKSKYKYSINQAELDKIIKD